MARTADQKINAKQCFPSTGASAQQGDSVSGNAALRNFIKALDACQTLLQSGLGGNAFLAGLAHRLNLGVN